MLPIKEYRSVYISHRRQDNKEHNISNFWSFRCERSQCFGRSYTAKVVSLPSQQKSPSVQQKIDESVVPVPLQREILGHEAGPVPVLWKHSRSEMEMILVLKGNGDFSSGRSWNDALTPGASSRGRMLKVLVSRLSEHRGLCLSSWLLANARREAGRRLRKLNLSHLIETVGHGTIIYVHSYNVARKLEP